MNNKTKFKRFNFCCIKQMAQSMVHNPDARPKMTDWYNPKQLIKTGIKAVLSTILGQYSDPRLIEAYGKQKGYFDFSKEYLQTEDGGYITDEEGFYIRDETCKREDIWIDYVSDLGEGFNSTYTVAYYLSRLKLKLEDPKSQKELATLRGNILIFGGDQVYPVSSRQKYLERLVTPYHLALRYTNAPHPQVFAIPGNHDWYDGLVSFTRLFCSHKWFNGWQAPQKKSYFALKLPHNWWLIGTDIQLHADIDGPQVQYFKDIAKKMKDLDRVILCNAEPYWISTRKEKKNSIICDENNLMFLENILRKHIQIFIAGDKHHYRRFEHIPQRSDKTLNHSLKTEKITSGGGGAFLHPTHNMRENYITEHFSDDCIEVKERKFERKKDFPTEQTSRELCRKNITFLWKNKKFGLVTAFIYLFVSLSVLQTAPIYSDAINFYEFSLLELSTITHSPISIFCILVIIGGFILFADGHSRRFKYIIGGLHGLCHILVAFVMTCCVVYLVRFTFNLGWNLITIIFSGLLIFIGGWIFGSVIMGLYLYISLNVFGYHGNEAFSSLKIEDWKNFLRIHIDKNGDLTIYPIGIEKTVQQWQSTSDSKLTSLLEPNISDDEQKKTIPKLIESPIVIPFRKS
ncbi:metallophosphoesterase [Clostridiaceae bacterium M8S5]|nr:metallophosphoesterase [Clostridiaceae bacterium M8S5]